MLDNISRETKLKICFLYTFVTTIPFGLIVLFAPGLFSIISDMPIQDQYIFGIAGSVWFAFGISSLLGFRNPEKFVPVLLMQFLYKVIWILVVAVPLLLTRSVQMYAILFVVVFISYIVLDIIAIPWSELLEKKK